MSEKAPISPELAAQISAKHADVERDLSGVEEAINRQQVSYDIESKGYTDVARAAGYERSDETPVDPEAQMNPLVAGGSKLGEEIPAARERNTEAAKAHFENNEEAYRTAAAKEAVESGVLVSTPEAIEAATTALASRFHEQWRETRRQEDGTFEPRLKETKDSGWIEAHGTSEVDIANTEFADLPSDWQAENAAAAEVVVGILDQRGGEVDLSDGATREELGSAVHDAWLERNAWAKGGELDKPFSELPKAEQDKDIAQIEVAQELFNGG